MSNKDLTKTDCFAYCIKNDESNKCNVLTKQICKDKKCNFYMTKENYNKKMQKFL
jgi:hypothetical protein